MQFIQVKIIPIKCGMCLYLYVLLSVYLGSNIPHEVNRSLLCTDKVYTHKI